MDAVPARNGHRFVRTRERPSVDERITDAQRLCTQVYDRGGSLHDLDPIDSLDTLATMGDAEGAIEAIERMRAAGLTVDPDDHLMVLVSYHVHARGEDAERYLRGLPPDELTTAHLALVLSAYAITGRADEAEALYLDYEDWPMADGEDCHVALLYAFSFVGEPRRAREWFRTVTERDEQLATPRMLVALVQAHSSPESLDELRALRDELDEETRRDPEVAGSLVRGFAWAGDPERAEEHLPDALAGLGPDDEEDGRHLVVCCIGAYRSSADEDIDRLLAIAEDAGVGLRDPRLTPGFREP